MVPPKSRNMMEHGLPSRIYLNVIYGSMPLSIGKSFWKPIPRQPDFVDPRGSPLNSERKFVPTFSQFRRWQLIVWNHLVSKMFHIYIYTTCIWNLWHMTWHVCLKESSKLTCPHDPSRPVRDLRMDRRGHWSFRRRWQSCLDFSRGDVEIWVTKY